MTRGPPDRYHAPRRGSRAIRAQWRRARSRTMRAPVGAMKTTWDRTRGSVSSGRASAQGSGYGRLHRDSVRVAAAPGLAACAPTSTMRVAEVQITAPAPASGEALDSPPPPRAAARCSPPSPATGRAAGRRADRRHLPRRLRAGGRGRGAPHLCPERPNYEFKGIKLRGKRLVVKMENMGMTADDLTLAHPAPSWSGTPRRAAAPTAPSSLGSTGLLSRAGWGLRLIEPRPRASSPARRGGARASFTSSADASGARFRFAFGDPVG